LTGYASGAAGKLFRHRSAADAVVNAVEAKMARRKRPGDEDAQIVRHTDTRNLYAMVGALIITAIVIVLAVLTYH
jgi:multisubunit Na+/H+ antiporter MnhC subunit